MIVLPKAIALAFPIDGLVCKTGHSLSSELPTNSSPNMHTRSCFPTIDRTEGKVDRDGFRLCQQKQASNSWASQCENNGNWEICSSRAQ
jgi:hypothetical protein